MQAVLAANSVIGNLTGSSATPAAVAATTTATASSVAVRDANANLTAANHLQGYTTTTASGTTYTLTVASNYQQYITGSTTQLVTLPVASTLVVGQAFWFQNSSTGAVTVQSSGANTVCVIASGASALVTCVLASGTTAASWSYVYAGAVTVSGKLVTFNNTLTFTGTDSTTITTPTTSAVMARTDAAQTFTGTQTFSSAPTFSSLTTAGVLLNNGSGVVSSSAGSSANFINADGSTTAHSLYATIASPTFTGTVTTPALTLSGFTTGALIETSGVVSALSGTNLVLGNGTTLAQSTFQTANTQLANFAALGNPGTSGFVLSSTTGGVLSWVASSGGMTNPMTTTGDMIYSSSGSTPARLAIGAAGTILVGGTTPSWSASPSITGILSTRAVAYGVLVVSSSPYTMTSASPYIVSVTVTSGTIKMPDETTIPLGTQFQINNGTSSVINIQDSAGVAIYSIGAYNTALLTSLSTSTATGNWIISVLNVFVPSGKSVAINNALTLAGTDGTTITFPTTSATVARTDAGQTFTGTQTFSSVPTFSTLTTAGVLLNNSSGVVSSSAGSAANFINADGSTTAHSLYATVASPTFTGIVTTPNVTVSSFAAAGVVQTSSAGVLSALASPGTNGWVLSSTTAGVLSWIAPGAFVGGTLTSNLTLMVGTTGTAPLTLQSGTNLTTAVAGSVEWNGTNLFVTSTGPTRNAVAWNPTTTTGDLIYASSTATPAALSRLAIVAAGSVLVSGATPAWASSPTLTGLTLSGLSTGTLINTSGVISALSGTNIVLASGSTVTQATFATAASPTFTGTVTLPTGLSGTLIATSGIVSALSGTNLVLGNGTTIAQSTFQAANANLTTVAGYAALTNLTSLTGLSNPGSTAHLQITSGGVMSWDTATYLTTGTASTTYATIASPTFTGTVTTPSLTVSSLTTAGVLKNNGSGVISSTASTSSNFVKGDGSLDSNTYLTANQTITLSGAVTGTGTTAITTAYGTIAANSVIANTTGSTAVPTAIGVVTTATASTFALRDANANLTAVNYIEGYSSTVTSATPVVLTVASTQQQYFTGSAAQTVTLPVTSTLVLGQSWTISNLSSAALTIQSSGANAVVVLAANTFAIVTCILTSGTTNTSWGYGYFGAVYSSGKLLSINSSLTLTGTDSTTMTFPSTSASIARTDALQTFTGVQTFSSAPTFSSLTTAGVLKNSGSGVISSTASTSSFFVMGDGSVVATSTYSLTASPTFTGTVTTPALTLSGFTTGTLINTSGVVSTLSGTNLVLASGSTITQATFATVASPTFTGTVTTPALTLSGFTTGTLINTSGVISALSGTNLVLGNGTTIAQSTFQAANANLTTVAGYTALTNLTSLTGLANPGSTSHLQITSGGVMSWDTATYLTTGTASTTYAPIASPTFTGTVTLPTGLSGALIATAGVVSNVVNNTSSYFVLGNGGTVAISTYLTTSTASTTYAPIASPTFTGTATTPSLTVSLLTTAGVLKNNASGVISSTAGTATQFVKADGSVDSSAYITGNQTITLTGAVTGTGTTAIATTYGSIAAGSVIANITGSAAVPVAVAAVSTATASSFAVRDSNANITTTNFIEGYTTTAMSGTTTTLVVSSTYLQYLN
jgi:hypothetical protein